LHTLPQGDLIPNFHLFYWMGLKVNGTWPSFDWVDPYIPGPIGYYTNWGITKPDQEPEPSRPDTGFAAGANYTEVQRSPPVWGWSDEDPGIKHIFICRTSGACCSHALQMQLMAAGGGGQRPGELSQAALLLMLWACAPAPASLEHSPPATLLHSPGAHAALHVPSDQHNVLLQHHHRHVC
jgi:hypothetical protein